MLTTQRECTVDARIPLVKDQLPWSDTTAEVVNNGISAHLFQVSGPLHGNTADWQLPESRDESRGH